jgi:hypothetical protein
MGCQGRHIYSDTRLKKWICRKRFRFHGSKVVAHFLTGESSLEHRTRKGFDDCARFYP